MRVLGEAVGYYQDDTVWPCKRADIIHWDRDSAFHTLNYCSGMGSDLNCRHS